MDARTEAHKDFFLFLKERELAEQLATALREVIERFDNAIKHDGSIDPAPTELFIGPMRHWFNDLRDALAVFDAARADSQGTATK